MKVLILAALEHELSSIPSKVKDWVITKKIIGVGTSSMNKKLPLYINQVKPELVILLGGCCGLTKEVKTGDIILPSEVFYLNHLHSPAFHPEQIHIKEKNEFSFCIHEGKTATSSEILRLDKKKEVHKKYPDWIAADMESYMALKICHEQYSLACLVIRSVVDCLEDDLPCLDLLVETRSSMPYLKKKKYELTQPKEWKKWEKLEKSIKYSNDSLRMYLKSLLTF